MSGLLKAIPTFYQGTQFRSRLEARWAAFFDACRWRWQYEAIDLDGWIPDFVLVGADAPVMVEVKPICWAGGREGMIGEAMERNDLAKVRAIVEREKENTTFPEILVLGAYPLDDILGVFLRECWNGDADVAMLVTGDPPLEFDFQADINSYAHRMGLGRQGCPLDLDDIDDVWRGAGNLVQWRAKAYG